MMSEVNNQKTLINSTIVKNVMNFCVWKTVQKILHSWVSHNRLGFFFYFFFYSKDKNFRTILFGGINIRWVLFIDNSTLVESLFSPQKRMYNLLKKIFFFFQNVTIFLHDGQNKLNKLMKINSFKSTLN